MKLNELPQSTSHSYAYDMYVLCVYQYTAVILLVIGKVKEIEEEMASSFSSKNLDVAGDVLAKMKYYQTILDNVGAKLGKE
jgi:hypothetical protein